MNAFPITKELEEKLDSRFTSFKSCAGGDAAHAYRGVLENGTRVFVKTARSGSPFRMEALGLKRFAKADQGVRVPEVLMADDHCLVLEFLDFGSPAPDYQQRLGAALAETHRLTHSAYGFDEDHAIGMTPQRNQPWIKADTASAWREFWWTHRLDPMFRRLHDPEIRELGDRLSHRLETWIPDCGEPPSLLHGDLWSGNIGADPRGAPMMFDPAPYYGHREAELGMTRLFGGFTEPFYETYQEAWPLMEGWRERMDVYMLYHVLNHAVLFDGSYLQHARRLLHDLL